MKLTEIKSVISQVIAEAKEAGELKKSSNKLVPLKKERDSLNKMKESLGSFQIAEGGEQSFVAEYAHMQKYVNEYNKLKDAHAKLSEMLDGQITEVETKIKSETQKIKEMMGLIEPASKKVEGKKAPKKDEDQEEKYVGDDEKYEFEKGKKAEKKIEKNQTKK
jgi:hypothetical protein